MRECAESTGLETHIYGPETHITAVVPLALGLAKLEDFPEFDDPVHVERPIKRSRSGSKQDLMEGIDDIDRDGKPRAELQPQKADHEADHHVENFTALTRCVVYGLQHRAVQGMLDFGKVE